MLVDAVHPSALAITAGGEIIVLDSGRGLFGFRPERIVLRSIVAGFGEFRGVDLATANLDGRGVIFVTMLSRQKGTETSRLVEYDEQGRQLASWPMPGPAVLFAGVAIDTAERRAYLANARTNEILMLPLTGSQAGPTLVSPTVVAKLKGEGFGPLAVDLVHRRLLVGAPVEGAVYVFGMNGGVQSKLKFAGDAVALALDRSGSRLFLLDSAAHYVRSADLRASEPKLLVFGKTLQLKEPRGLVVAPDGTLWIADAAGGALAAVSSDGTSNRIVRLINQYR
jgi:hypothetical protein